MSGADVQDSRLHEYDDLSAEQQEADITRKTGLMDVLDKKTRSEQAVAGNGGQRAGLLRSGRLSSTVPHFKRSPTKSTRQHTTPDLVAMSENRFLTLNSIIDEAIERYNSEAINHKKQYHQFRFWAICLTALSTILAASSAIFDGGFSKILDLSIVAATAVAAAVISIEGIRKPAELWIVERGIFHSLWELKREILFVGSEQMTDEQLEDLFERTQDVLHKAQSKWRGGTINTKKGEHVGAGQPPTEPKSE